MAKYANPIKIVSHAIFSTNNTAPSKIYWIPWMVVFAAKSEIVLLLASFNPGQAVRDMFQVFSKLLVPETHRYKNKLIIIFESNELYVVWHNCFILHAPTLKHKEQAWKSISNFDFEKNDFYYSTVPDSSWQNPKID